GTNLIHTCFSLIFVVPDQVINWAGGVATATLGRETTGEVRGALAVFAGKLERIMPGSKRSMPKGEGGSRSSETDGMRS
ncbi:DotA/TraY family protein, partial [Burkholderia cenocepacia]